MVRYRLNKDAVANIRRLIEERHKAIELAAHELLQDLDRKSGLIGRTTG